MSRLDKRVARLVVRAVLAALVVWSLTSGGPSARATDLTIQGGRFRLNGRPTFLLGISYFAALGAPEKTVRRDLDAMQRCGFNWIRVWATWAAYDNDVSAVDADGRARAPFLARLEWLVAECDRRGVVVDVTLARGDGTGGSARLPGFTAHQRAVETLVSALKPHHNWFLDLSNERNIGDRRFTSIADLSRLRLTVKRLDPRRLVTASHGGDISQEELRDYLTKAGLDFVCPHRPRDAGSAAQTEAKTRQYRDWMHALGRAAPVLYQEPFRRGYGGWEPTADDFQADLNAARAGGASGWCFHNGSTAGPGDGQPRRSFDLRAKGLFSQFDAEEKTFLEEQARSRKPPRPQ